MGFINPKQILRDHLGLKKNMLAADFGCGGGQWAVELAQILEQGKVYAIDLLDEPLSATRSRAKMENVENVEVVKGDIEKLIPRLLADSLDLVLMTNLLFQIKDKKLVFEEAKRVLKSGGKILVIDWKESAFIGPEKKLPPAELKTLAAELGFSLFGEFSAGNFHYGLIFEKQ
jgi:ubiquinone/menaquinone biosynthesis C-methylase UbiE